MSASDAIAFFLPSLVGGGAERVVVNLAQGISERGLPVHLVLAEATGPLLEQVPPGVRVVDLRAARVLRSLKPLAEYLRRERPRVLLSSMGHANIIALWAGKLSRSGVPIIVIEHNTLSQESRHERRLVGRIWPQLLRTFYPWATSVVAVSRGAAEDLARTSGLARSRIEVVYNPVITDAATALTAHEPDHPWLAPGESPVFLGVGRLTRQKDFVTLVRAFAEVRRLRRSRLIILGEGEERPAIEAVIRELGLGEEVALPGFHDNALAFMRRASVFVLSSAWEGLPTVLIEALSAGARVVSTDCPSGPREILQDGRLGTLAPVGNHEALAAAMLAALAKPAGSVPAEALAPFTMRASVDHYLQVIEKAAPSPRRQPAAGAGTAGGSALSSGAAGSSLHA